MGAWAVGADGCSASGEGAAGASAMIEGSGSGRTKLKDMSSSMRRLGYDECQRPVGEYRGWDGRWELTRLRACARPCALRDLDISG